MTETINTPTLSGNHKKSNTFLIFLLVFFLLVAIGLGLYTVMTQQLSTKSRAEDVASGSATIEVSTTPSQLPEVTNSVTEPSTEPTVEPSASAEPLMDETAEVETDSDTPINIVTPTTAEEADESATPEATVAPTQALVSALSCPANGATCAWDGVAGATSYSVTVVDKTTSDVILTQTVSSTSVNFTPIIEHNYQCSVQAVNECGVSASASAENTCRSNVTPTVTPQVTATPGPSATPGQGPSATPTPPSGTVIVQSGDGPQPTIPTAGSSSTVYFMVIATILVVTLFLVF